MRTSPLTVHFCVSQFGLQLWFINRDELPFGPASITRSYKGEMERWTLRHQGTRNTGWRTPHWTMFQYHWCYLGEGEHVEVGHVIFLRTFDSLLALLWVYYLSHILRHKVTLEEIKTLHFYIVIGISPTTKTQTTQLVRTVGNNVTDMWILDLLNLWNLKCVFLLRSMHYSLTN